ncbi:MAG: YqjF family protein [Anaerolineae bacterium]
MEATQSGQGVRHLKAVVAETGHRPWPMPDRPWNMTQTWSELLFAHYPVRPEELRPLIPPSLPLDLFDGDAWVGVVPFRMSYVRPRLLPAVPGLSFFPELNVRTYVTVNGKPGVYFFSLEAANPIAVWIARRLFKLPYFNARMSCQRTDNHVRYSSNRTHRGAPTASFKARYRPTGPVFHSSSGSLEHWFTERYALYSVGADGTVFRGEIHLQPWPLQPAELNLEMNTMLSTHGVRPALSEPLLHYTDRIKVVVWSIERVQST